VYFLSTLLVSGVSLRLLFVHGWITFLSGVIICFICVSFALVWRLSLIVIRRVVMGFLNYSLLFCFFPCRILVCVMNTRKKSK
jgi:hypothetical protein